MEPQREDIEFGYEHLPIASASSSTASSPEQPPPKRRRLEPDSPTPPPSFCAAQKRPRPEHDPQLSPGVPHIQPPLADLPQKRQRFQSPPQPDRGEKRARANSEGSVTQPGPETSKRWKPDPEPSSSASKPINNRNPVPRPKSKPVSAPLVQDSSLLNFVPGPAAQTEYAEQVSLADELREAGNTAYQARNYKDAIEFYTAAAEAYPLQPLPDRPAHPGYTASLANRASAHMALNDHTAAVADLRQSMKSTILPPLLPDSLRTTLARRILRLVKCHLALLEPKDATDAIEHISKPGQPVFLAHSHPLWQEMSILSLRTNKLAKSMECLERERGQKRWKEALGALEAVEQLSISWAYCQPPLPGFWRCWKAEAQVWLGETAAAHETLNHNVHTTLPDDELKAETARVQGLIYMAKGSLESAIRSFDQALIGHEDPSVRQMRDRAQMFKLSLARIERLTASGPNSNYALVLTLASGMLSGSEGTIERLVRIKLSVITCEAKLKLLQLKSSVQSECAKVLAETGFKLETRHELLPEYRPLIIRALLCRARATGASVDYKLLKHILRLDGWTTGLTIDLVEVYREIERHLTSERPRPLPSRSALCKSARDPKGYYSILQVSHLAPAADLKRSYRALCRTCHPDKGGQTAVFQQLQEAFDILSDPVKRNAYDRGHHR